MNRFRLTYRLLWIAITLPFLLGGVLAAWLSFQSMRTWQALGGKLVSDSELEILQLIPEQTIRLGLITAAVLLIGLAVVMMVKPEWLRQQLINLKGVLKNVPGDVKAFITDLRGWPHDRRDGWILLCIVLVSLLIRVPLLDRPMGHDESYTVVTWAPGPLEYILEDYHLPNNHIFHTILVSWTYDLFGSQPWSVRLPAFVAAILLIPTGYGLTRRWYGRVPALVAAAIIGLAPIIGDYGTNARGYSLFMLFSLLIFWIAARLVRRNNTIEWLLLAVFSALGFWTVPMMLYPFGGVCVWIGLSALFDQEVKQIYGSSLRLIRYVFIMGIFTIILTGLMYFPVIRYSGTEQLFNNSFIAPLSFKEFWPTLIESRLPETFAEWMRGFGVAGSSAIIVGIFLSVYFQKRSSRYAIHALWAILLWVIPILLMRRPNAWARTWSFLFPLGYIWAAAGWVWLVSRLKFPAKKREVQLWSVRIAVVMVMVAGLALSFNHSRQQCPAIPCPPGDEEQTVQFLLPRLEKTDLVLVQSPSNAAMWYYFGQYGLSHDHFRRNLPFYRAYLLVSPTDDQSVEEIITHFGFSEPWFEMQTLSLMHNTARIQIYQIEANKDRVNFEYGIK